MVKQKGEESSLIIKVTYKKIAYINQMKATLTIKNRVKESGC